MFGLGLKELIILAGIVILLFGAKKIPELAGSVGEAGRQLRKGFSDAEDDEKGKKPIKKVKSAKKRKSR